MIKAVIKAIVPQSIWFYMRSKRYLARRKFAQSHHAELWETRKQVSFVRSGITINLCIVDPQDGIQKLQSTGFFYEEAELNSIAPFFKKGGVFVDIGANTGQHSIYFAKLLGASKVVLFEPVPLTCKILRENIRINNLEGISDLSNLELGLSDRPGRASFTIEIKNIGAATLWENTNGDLHTITGDSVLANQHVDFLKIDTEGFEIKVLKGLAETISKSKPTIFIEVDNNNLPEFESFVKDANYEIIQRYKTYDANENFLIVAR